MCVPVRLRRSARACPHRWRAHRHATCSIRRRYCATGFAREKSAQHRGEGRHLRAHYPTGVETVQYLGVRDGRAFFKRHTVNVETGATTMNSTPLVIPNTATTTHSGSVNVYGPNGYGFGSYSGTSTTVLPPTVIPPRTPAPVVMDDGSLLLSVDLSRKPARLSVAGKTLAILQADSARLVYVLSE